ncbi:MULTISPECIES: hypothetical protein [Acinetobacter]|uniref:Uncharacterized protein n=1 Tax=Acinetobacter nematophilus TaxID=2994642 RepID=A0A9X3II98_9GAMM|nr:hypothetical protein [Acinetobacter nematophilus]MCX5468084.1 hypothetical protein [Acinetobacter nematophilus]
MYKSNSKVIIASFFLMLFKLTDANALSAMSDEEMSKATGQTLFTLQYIAANDPINPNTNIGFYRLGMEAKLEINANINRLQLGCGGTKGIGCDIDLSEVRLTGSHAIDGNYSGTDAILGNPFLEFAINHPDSASRREIVGFRYGAESILGLLSIGSNPDPLKISDDRGINSISGDLNITVSDSKLSNGCVQLIVCLPFTGNLATYNTSLSVNRSNTIDLTGLQATTTSVVGFPVGLTLNNINVLDQPLSTVHNLLLSKDKNGTIPTSDFYLSLQSRDIIWQKLSTQKFDNPKAQAGWWISLPNLQISNLDIQQQIDVSAADVISGILFNQPIYINPIDLGHRPSQNCYGNLKFC